MRRVLYFKYENGTLAGPQPAIVHDLATLHIMTFKSNFLITQPHLHLRCTHHPATNMDPAAAAKMMANMTPEARASMNQMMANMDPNGG